MIKSWIALVVGAVLLAAAAGLLAYQYYVTKEWASARAVVTGNETKYGRGGPAGKIPSKAKYAPKLSFTVGDSTYEIVGDVEAAAPWQMGETVAITYSADNPTRATMVAPWQQFTGIATAAAFGILMLLIAFGAL